MPRRAEGIPAGELSDADLERELRHLYETRAETFFGGSRAAFQRHTERMHELETEYATRHAGKLKPAPERTRAGSRARAGQKATGGASKTSMRKRSTRATASGSERAGGRGRRSAAATDETLKTKQRSRSGRNVTRTDRSGKRDEGRTTGRGRGVPGMPGSLGRQGGTSKRGGGKQTGAANRPGPRRTASAAATRGTGGRRRVKSGAQG